MSNNVVGISLPGELSEYQMLREITNQKEEVNNKRFKEGIERALDIYGNVYWKMLRIKEENITVSVEYKQVLETAIKYEEHTLIEIQNANTLPAYVSTTVEDGYENSTFSCHEGPEEKHKLSTNLLRKVSAVVPMPIFDIIKEVKQDILENMLNQYKFIGTFTLLGTIISSIGGIRTALLLIFLITIALIDLLAVFAKGIKQSQTGVNEKPFLVKFIFFCVFIGGVVLLSWAQVYFENSFLNKQGDTTDQFINYFFSIINLQSVSLIYPIGYYASSIVRSLKKATSQEDTTFHD